ncbi:MAG: DNA repair protein RecO [Gammaproteobacteria bacterium]|jgi:DNA repair protein RecO (recombination protein O)|nr:DNA repair protein RecO [Gammaproteobacteria bacterium]MDP6734055.1 DNA repair protein RecO [Gammaproteobacteria bacterium]|tara:strand:+ start:90 stop:806 length:717 start_codon:yes stop_codon:yes gene_type:complete
MESRVLLQPAYVLHRAPFQNTSLLVDFFTLDYGRVRAVAKGARREKSKYRALLQPFHPLLVSVSGRGEVKTVAGVETGLAAILLQGERLFSGLYVNELLTRLLHNQEEHTALYKHYQETLIALQGSENIECVLRRFELNLLAELGYALNLEEDFRSHEAIEPDSHYRFIPDMGFELLPSDDANDNPRSFQGRHLVRLREMDLQDRDTAKSAKRLLRIALTAHLGEKPINSRGLFARKQ